MAIWLSLNAVGSLDSGFLAGMLASGVAAAAINSLTGGAGGAVLGRTVDL